MGGRLSEIQTNFFEDAQRAEDALFRNRAYSCSDGTFMAPHFLQVFSVVKDLCTSWRPGGPNRNIFCEETTSAYLHKALIFRIDFLNQKNRRDSRYR